MFLTEIISTAKEGIVEKYKARFDPDPNSDGYIFYKDDYGNGVKCSRGQYEAYICEFKAFVISKNRFMFWWFLTCLVVGAMVLGYMVFVLGHKELPENDLFKNIWLALMLLPLIVIFSKGKALYQKPSYDLGSGNEIGRERHSKEMILNRRLRGASYQIPIIGILFSSLGLYFDVYDENGGYDSPYMRYYFIVGILGFLWFFWRIYKAKKSVEKV